MSKKKEIDKEAGPYVPFGGHSTPLPIKGLKRLRLDAARRGEPMISKAAWLRRKQ